MGIKNLEWLNSTLIKTLSYLSDSPSHHTIIDLGSYDVGDYNTKKNLKDILKRFLNNVEDIYNCTCEYAVQKENKSDIVDIQMILKIKE